MTRKPHGFLIDSTSSDDFLDLEPPRYPAGSAYEQLERDGFDTSDPVVLAEQLREDRRRAGLAPLPPLPPIPDD